MKKPPSNPGQLGLFSSAPVPISKSQFVAGWQCEKYLWFERFEANTKSVDAYTRFLMQQGSTVGRLAQKLFPDAQFEVSAEAEGAMARADILRPVAGEKGLFDLYEVKTSGYDPERPYAEDKQEFLWDLALQAFVFEKSGKPIRKAHLVLVNKEYVRQGEVDPQAFFIVEDVSSEIRSRSLQVPNMLARFKNVSAMPQAPDVAIGMHCKKPHDCPFQARCFPEMGKDHLFGLRMLWWKDKFKYYHQGIRRIQDYPAARLDPWQAKQVAVLKSGQPLIDRGAIKAFLAKLEYPLYHLDFETCNPAIPPFDGIKPFRHSVFQYSLHIQDSPGAEPRHFEYLPDHRHDPRDEMLEKLLGELGERGSILAYFASFEMTRLKELAEAFPRHRPRIEAALARFQDLEKPFSEGHYLHPGMGGRSSIKVVLPSLVPELSYEGMPIAEGTGAIQGYLEFLDPATPKEKASQIRRDLLAYCKLDTLAMVKILAVLEGL
jgi:hypothetical protein